MKKELKDLAIFGGNPAFPYIKSTSNLPSPPKELFFNYARSTYDNNQFTNNGPMVQELERRLASLHQSEYCVVCCSGFMSILLAIHTMALPNRTEILMPSLTYRRMADIAIWAGFLPRFCDVDPDTLAISAATAELALNGNTALILAAHPITNLCDIEGIEDLADYYTIPLLFDSVEAAYSSHKGKMVGAFGDAEAFSLHASKLLNGCEGGYITTNKKDIADKIRKKRDFDFYPNRAVNKWGLNAKMHELHAAMAISCIRNLNSQIAHNRRCHIAYQSINNINGLYVIPYSLTEKRGWKNVLVHIGHEWLLDRESTIRILHAENMLVRPYYYPPLHVVTKLQAHPRIDLPVTDELTNQYLLFPSGEFITVEDIEIINRLMLFLHDNSLDIKRRISKDMC